MPWAARLQGLLLAGQERARVHDHELMVHLQGGQAS